MFTKFLLQPVIAILTLLAANFYLPGIYFETGTSFEVVALAGVTLGFLNYPIKPLLKIITLPIRILTLGVFSFIINIAIVYVVDLAFPELIFEGITEIFIFIIALWLVNLILNSILN